MDIWRWWVKLIILFLNLSMNCLTAFMSTLKMWYIETATDKKDSYSCVKYHHFRRTLSLFHIFLLPQLFLYEPSWDRKHSNYMFDWIAAVDWAVTTTAASGMTSRERAASKNERKSSRDSKVRTAPNWAPYNGKNQSCRFLPGFLATASQLIKPLARPSTCPSACPPAWSPASPYACLPTCPMSHMLLQPIQPNFQLEFCLLYDDDHFDHSDGADAKGSAGREKVR